jgi:hypothetical protein
MVVTSKQRTLAASGASWNARAVAVIHLAIGAGEIATVSLGPGVYVAEAGGSRAGFEVTATAKVVPINEPVPAPARLLPNDNI